MSSERNDAWKEVPTMNWFYCERKIATFVAGGTDLGDASAPMTATA